MECGWLGSWWLRDSPRLGRAASRLVPCILLGLWLLHDQTQHVELGWACCAVAGWACGQMLQGPLSSQG